jgi:hypothetical protein
MERVPQSTPAEKVERRPTSAPFVAGRSRSSNTGAGATGGRSLAELIQRARSASPPVAAAPTAVRRIQRATAAGVDVIRRAPNKKGDEVIADLSRPDWSPPGAPVGHEPERSISADQMNTLLRSAAIAAYTTYAYHATKSRNVDGIRRDGLDPDRGGSGAAKGSEFEQHSKSKVHYARNVNTVGAYKDYAEGGTPFGPNRRDADPAPAEILQVAVPRDIAQGEQVDPDSPKTDAAFTTDQRIDPRFIRSTEPKAIPAKPPDGGERRLEEGANEAIWTAHMREGIGESIALKSNMDADGLRVLAELVRAGYEEETLLNTIRQALRSMPASAILPFAQYWQTNSRVRSSVDATGQAVPFKHQ